MMMKILLCCAAGMSTSMVVQRMEKAAQANDIQAKIEAVSMDEFHERIAEFDCCLLGPQVKYKLKEFQQAADEFNKPVAVINMMDYGMMNGEKILNAAIAMIKQQGAQ